MDTQELRDLQMKVLMANAALVCKKMKTGADYDTARDALRIWVARQMGLEVEKCFVARFDKEQCEKFLRITEAYTN